MTQHPTNQHDDPTFGEDPRADRPATAEEAAATERARPEVDVDAVAEHAEEMNHIGANVRGEGQIKPT